MGFNFIVTLPKGSHLWELQVRAHVDLILPVREKFVFSLVEVFDGFSYFNLLSAREIQKACECALLPSVQKNILTISNNRFFGLGRKKGGIKG